MPPGPIEPTRVLSFTSGPHTLYGEYFAAAGSPSGVVVMVHGYAEHCGRYREVAAVLESFGAPHQGAGTGPTHIFNLGHGISQFTPPENVKVLVDAVHAHSKRIRAQS